MTQTHNNEGRDEIIECYDLDQLTTIANHGCASSVPHSHFTYEQTISFFDKYEAEILSTIEEQLGREELYKTFERSNACYDMYRNECTWLFIELAAQDVVIQHEQIADEQEQVIMDYMLTEPKDSTNFYTSEDGELLERTGFNSPQSMNLNRYSQV